MPIDPSIILGLRPVQPTQLQDPIETYGRAMSLKTLAGQQQLQALQTESAARELQHAKLYDQAARESGGDLGKMSTRLLELGNAEGAIKVSQAHTMALKNAADYQKVQGEIRNQALKENQESWSDVRTPEDARLHTIAEYANPVLGPILASHGQTLEQSLAKIPADSAAFEQYRAQKAMGLAKYIEANKPTIHTQNLGGTSNIVSVPGLGGAPTVVSSTPTTMTQAERANLGLRSQEVALHRLTADPFGLLTGAQGAAAVGGGATPAQAAPVAPNASPQPATAPAPVRAPAATAPAVNPNAAPGSILAGISPDTHGEEFLAKLPPNVAGQVKALAEGRMAFPSGMGLRSPVVQQLLGMVSQYDPSFDAVNYQGRNTTFKSFSGGADAEKVKNINQTLHHAGQLYDAIEKLDNFSGAATPLNSVVNPAQRFFGDSRQGVFEQKAQAVASELRKVYAGAGGGSLTELQKWEESLPVNASKAQQKAYLQSGMELLNGALSALQEKYQAGMGPRADVGKLLKPEARAILQRLAPGALQGSTETSAPITPSQADIDAELRRRGVIK